MLREVGATRTRTPAARWRLASLLYTIVKRSLNRLTICGCFANLIHPDLLLNGYLGLRSLEERPTVGSGGDILIPTARRMHSASMNLGESS